MSAPANASLVPFLTLTTGFTIRVTALDPATGADVSGVSTSNMALGVDQDDTSPDTTQTPGDIFLVPGPALEV